MIAQTKVPFDLIASSFCPSSSSTSAFLMPPHGLIRPGIGWQKNVVIAVGLGLDLSGRIIVRLTGAMARIIEDEIIFGSGLGRDLVKGSADIANGRRPIEEGIVGALREGRRSVL